MTLLKAIRLRCLECSAGSIKEVRLCPVHDCELYQYRMGHNPKRKGLGGKPPTQRAVSGVECEERDDDQDAYNMLDCFVCGRRDCEC